MSLRVMLGLGLALTASVLSAMGFLVPAAWFFFALLNLHLLFSLLAIAGCVLALSGIATFRKAEGTA